MHASKEGYSSFFTNENTTQQIFELTLPNAIEL
jgi:hypothetical protein